MFFRKRKMAKRLQDVGSQVLVQYIVELNNEEGRTFESRSAALAYIKAYREENTIFSLKMYRIEIYSL